MCGINGAFDNNFDQNAAINQMKQMNDLIKHRGPDSDGIYFDDGFCLGHTRLSIIDVSNNADQPMISSDGRFIIAFNGEIYNFQELSKFLVNEFSIKPRTSSDTEVLVNLIQCIGIKQALEKVEGMFAFCLYDIRKKQVYIARDRFGEKPLYFYCRNRCFYFSSEMKPLISSLKNKLTINFDSLEHFLQKSYVSSTSSIFNEITKVKPSTYLRINLANTKDLVPEEITYWDYQQLAIDGAMQSNNSFQDSYNSSKNHLTALLDRTIQQTMVSDVPLGAFLSGGYDSSCVVALMQKNSLKKIKTFSIGFDDALYNEAEDAKRIATHLGTDHKELYLSEKDLLDTIMNLPNIYSEPFADSSQIPTILLSKLTRSQVTVSLSGDGGDEIFGGYGRYFLGQRLKSYLDFMPYRLRKALKSSDLIRFQKPLIKLLVGNKVTNFDQKFNKFEKVFDFRDDKNLFDKLALFDNKFLITKSAPSDPDLIWNTDISYYKKAMIADAIDYLPGDILTKVDIAGMSVSLETRIPLLNHKIAEYVTKLPLSFLHQNGTGKFILKDIVHQYIPKDLMDRPKKGFDIPLGWYIRNELNDYMHAQIDYGKTFFNDIFDFNEIDRVFDDHNSSKIENPNLLWNLASFFAWHEQHIK
tara:strand:+ start:69 stop:1988 length:1920 start_codon:yes stop_codon:yes gene_type:complete